jgi:hypothetical protein
MGLFFINAQKIHGVLKRKEYIYQMGLISYAIVMWIMLFWKKNSC